MSLIPYHPHEGREIVLRHRNALVVRDPDSQLLEIRGHACPTCHQPLPQSSAGGHAYDRSYEGTDDSFVDPEYFRMLRRGNYNFLHAAGRASQSPVRSLPRPSYDTSPRGFRQPEVRDEDEELELHDTPQRRGSRIRREAFTPNYFKTFFREERVLGKGGKGVVLLVRHEIAGCSLGHFACKRVPVGDDHAWLEKTLIEVELLAALSHPNLVSYRHAWLEDVDLGQFAPSVACAFILQQYCNGGDLQCHVVGEAPTPATKEELKARMRRRSKGQPEPPGNLTGNKSQLALEEIYSLFKDVTSGVAYLHAANYIHRDLKPSNCLLHRENSSLRCLISDFGEVQAENTTRKSTGSTGTISYCAPEVLKLDPATGRYGNFTTKSDMFSLGMILYFMCFGKLPYRSANAIQEELEDVELLRAEITDWQGFIEERRERPDLPAKLYTLLKKLLALDPAERPSANEVLHAMKSETNFDALGRPDRANTVLGGVRSNRVQSLDSPAGPGTPVPDTTPNTNRGSRFREGRVPWATSEDPDANDQGIEQSLAVSHRDINGYQDGSTTPTATNTLATAPRGVSRDNHRHHQRTPTTPLLLAPPRSLWADIEHRVSVALYYVCWAIGVEMQSLVYAFQLAVFVVKAATLLRPCWPYVASLQVSAPLLVVAALELLFASSPVTHGNRLHGEHYHIGGLFQARGTGTMLLAFHFATLWLAGRWDALCVHGPRQGWAEW
ncbi:protein kinase [Cordyceps fumosorosea ARSEF 2679]|uniref:non-specific serine/threonine protein kinase n=1 Tax=Cordyceps fumosorosea (strain ARSEF 2679) TaxID=1081104 RepID=A0A162N055_CORFA|nr:protein kinase [Cordyceps fumosorosea ARSEF 2679]OAA73399.1 protein kinase [Cordyceps fumosorosea ARSEF 2679]